MPRQKLQYQQAILTPRRYIYQKNNVNVSRETLKGTASAVPNLRYILVGTKSGDMRLLLIDTGNPVIDIELDIISCRFSSFFLLNNKHHIRKMHKVNSNLLVTII